jgi:hypothetical protein
MYDCQCLRRPMRAPDFKDRQVWQHLYGISAQGAAPIFFIGLADYTWNPEAYDPARSLKLAVRELADRDPAFYRVLYDYVPRFLPRDEMLALEQKNTEGMLARLAALEPFLDKGRLARISSLAQGVNGLTGLATPVRERESGLAMMQEHGFKEYRVGRAAGITIDGHLDEPAWRDAPVMDTFVHLPWFKKGTQDPLPDGVRSATARALYDDTAVYLAMTFKGADEEIMAYVKESLAGDPKPAELREGCHRLGPTLEAFVKTDMTQSVRWQVLLTVPNFYNGDLRHYFDPAAPYAANHFKPEPDFRYVVTGDDSYAFEGKIPYWANTAPPKKGDAWGVQLQLNKMFADKGEPYWLYWWTYSYKRNSALFAFEFPYGCWVFE